MGPNTLDLQRFLDRLTSRSLLTNEEKNAVLGLHGHSAQVQSNRDFVKLGEQTDCACLIVAGYVGRFDQNSNGERQITALHIPGDMADLHSVVQPEATSALQALSTATIIRIPHSQFRATAAAYPAVAEALWRDCMVDASILAQWVVNLGRRDARARIAHVLCEMAVRLGVAPAKGEIMFPFPVTQTQLGDVTGLTAVHVNRMIQSLRREGLADIRHNATIYDWDALVRAGDFDADYLQTNVKPHKRLPSVSLNGNETMTSNDVEYYRARAIQEREHALAADRQDVAAIHLELASLYDALVALPELRPTPELLGRRMA